jgi:hypothetical protein
MKKISTVIALWKDGYFSDKEVIAWADTQILKSEDVLDDSLIELSLKGPAYCENLGSYVFPETRGSVFWSGLLSNCLA